jgi:Zn-dependent protease with chaperone function
MLRSTAAYAPPSAIARAAVSLVLLLGFYLVVLGIAGLLLAAPIALLIVAFNVRLLLLIPVCWVPAALLIMSAFNTRRPSFAPPGRRLATHEAPALFQLIEELASRAGTAPPSEVFLDVEPNLAVTEAGSVFRSRRILILGVPLLHLLSVDELRAGIAHELGHFIGGDTRLTTFTLQTHALFASVTDTVARDPFRVGTQHYTIEGGLALAQAIGLLIVRGYSHLYLLITRPIGRRQELAADALSAALVGAPIAAAALEKIAISAPLYQMYLHEEVAVAVKHGAMPIDVAEGFQRLRARVLAGEAGRAFANAVRTQATDRYDTHPALIDRLSALEKQPPTEGERDLRSALSLVAELVAFDAAFVAATREHVIQILIAKGSQVTELRELTWQQIPQEVLAPAALESARRVAERLHPLFPTATTLGSMFSAVWHRLDSGAGGEILMQLEPTLAQMPPAHAQRWAVLLSNEVLGTLLQGALIGRGASVEDSLGEPALILQLGEERVDTSALLRLLATDAATGRAAFTKWAERLEHV